MSIFALFHRQLRQDTKNHLTYIVRFLMLGYILLSLIWACFISQYATGAPGLDLFRALMYLNAVWLSLAAITFYSTVITVEKEEGTLPLLRLTNLNTLAILVGKSSSKTVNELLLLLLQIPFTLLAITLGGLTFHQIICAYFSLLSFLIFLANLGLFCSVSSQSSRQAAFHVGLILLIYLLLPPLLMANYTTGGQLGQWIGGSSVFWQLVEIFQTNYKGDVFSFQVISNLLAGLVLFAISWVLFTYSSDYSAPSGTTEPFSILRFLGIKKIPAGKIWKNHFAWKDFHYQFNGYGSVALKSVFYLIVIICIGGIVSVTNNNQDTMNIALILPLVVAIMFESMYYASTFFRSEVKNNTLSLLILSSPDTKKLIRQKSVAVFYTLTPALILLLITLFICLVTNPPLFVTIIFSPLVYAGIFVWICWFFFITYFSVLVSWGGAILGTLCFMFCSNWASTPARMAIVVIEELLPIFLPGSNHELFSFLSLFVGSGLTALVYGALTLCIIHLLSVRLNSIAAR